jgi:hypothetical protein
MRTTLFLLVVAAIAVWLYLRRRKSLEAAAASSEKQRLPSSQTDSKYHAVSIKFPMSACDAAKDLEGQRFLASDAPRLPLPRCTRDERCECRFQHYDDRRTGRDRRSPFASGGIASSTGSYERERRRVGGRREDDQD